MIYDYNKRIFNQSSRRRREYTALSIDDLFSLLRERDSVNRFAAASLLCWKNQKNIISRCLNLLKDSKDFRERETSAHILGQFEELTLEQALLVVPHLMHAARHDKAISVKTNAIIALSWIYSNFTLDYKTFLPLLQECVTSPSPNIRHAVASSLVHEGISHDIRPLLEKLLADPVEKVRDWAGLAVNMSACDSPKIRNALISMLKDKRKNGKREALNALASRGDVRIIPVLKEELEQDDLLDDTIKAAAKLGDPQFIPILENLLDKFDDSDDLIQSSIDHLKSLSETSSST